MGCNPEEGALGRTPRCKRPRNPGQKQTCDEAGCVESMRSLERPGCQGGWALPAALSSLPPSTPAQTCPILWGLKRPLLPNIIPKPHRTGPRPRAPASSFSSSLSPSHHSLLEASMLRDRTLASCATLHGAATLGPAERGGVRARARRPGSDSTPVFSAV